MRCDARVMMAPLDNRAAAVIGGLDRKVSPSRVLAGLVATLEFHEDGLEPD